MQKKDESIILSDEIFNYLDKIATPPCKEWLEDKAWGMIIKPVCSNDGHFVPKTKPKENYNAE